MSRSESLTLESVRSDYRFKGLEQDEPLIFELDSPGYCGVDIPAVDLKDARLGDVGKRGRIGLPDLAEPTVVRHYTRLSRKNYAIDLGIYPLGSCTMKHNPRFNEKVARWFSDIHPLQPFSSVQGALEVLDRLSGWLLQLTGMARISLTPSAGAQGELCGMMAIRGALKERGETRPRVLVPESAHGTNPATATACGFKIEAIPSNSQGTVDLQAFRRCLDTDVAAIMLTNPNTCGLFESEIIEIAALVHEAGGYFYCDGANFNAIVGRVKVADLGIDAMHINLHKTFSTPHGGGGPGSGPVVFSEALAPYVPLPYVVRDEDGSLRLIEHDADSLGRLRGFHGQMGMFIRALTYIMSHGADGLRQVSGDAVLNANYILAELKDTLSLVYEGRCMHEVLFDDRCLKGTGVTTLDIAKALIDGGIHPMTIYFPLIARGAMLIEPTETETKASLDYFIDLMKGFVSRARSGDVEFFKQAPRHAPNRRFDETAAARKPVLRWKP